MADWPTETGLGDGFTECVDFWVKDIAKKDMLSLSRLLAEPPVPAVAVVDTRIAAPVVITSDHRLPETMRIECAQYMLI